MNVKFIFRSKALFQLRMFKLFLLFAVMKGVEVNGQTVYFGNWWVPMSSTDGVNFTLSNYDANAYGTECWFYSEFDGNYYVSTTNGSGVAIQEAWNQQATLSPIIYQTITYNVSTHIYQLISGDCAVSLNSMSLITAQLSSTNLCSDVSLTCLETLPTANWSYQWLKNGQNISGANTAEYIASASNNSDVYSCLATCNTTGQSVVTNTYTKNPCSSLNYMLVQNVTIASSNAAQGTAQVQFDLNWGNSWRDSINWDAAWVFMKYKNAAGEWKHAKINPTGYDHGIGTNNIIQPTADKMGAFVRLADYGQTNFSVDGLQLQWNYGLDGVSNPANLEIKVFATEMVYMPQGDFNVIKKMTYGDGYPLNIKAPGDNAAVINTRMTPILTTGNSTQFRVKGDAGLDSNVDGVIDSPDYPTGYTPFYAFKYEMTEQQYADFLNCLTSLQQNTIGVAGSSISLNNGIYYAAAPNRVCNGYSNERFLAFSDWAGLRPMSVLEFSKAVFGPYANHQEWSDRGEGSYDVGRLGLNQGTGYYGMKDAYSFSAGEPMVTIASNQFSKFLHGDGVINPSGLHNQSGWDSIEIINGNGPDVWGWYSLGQTCFRFVRTAE